MSGENGENTFRAFLERMAEEGTDRDQVLARYGAGPAELAAALDGLSEPDLDLARGQAKWTIRQIVHHVVNGDDIWSMCVKAAVGSPGCTFTMGWYDYQGWVDTLDFGGRPVVNALALLRANRAYVTELIQRFPQAWSWTVRVARDEVPEGFEITVERALFIQAAHIPWHVRQIRETRERHQA